jgi:hypothetical protein
MIATTCFELTSLAETLGTNTNMSTTTLDATEHVWLAWFVGCANTLPLHDPPATASRDSMHIHRLPVGAGYSDCLHEARCT